MNNCPYPDKPGVPLNPEKDGFHWIKGWNETPFVAEWFVDQSEDFGGYYGWHDGADNPQGIVAQGWSYLGPCLTPSKASRLRDIVATMLSVMPAFPAAAKCIVGMEDRYNAAIEQARAFLVAEGKDD